MFIWHNDKLSSTLHCIALEENGSDYVLNDQNEMICNVYQERSANGPIAPDLRALHVRFENGGHTRWHYHEGWQVLVGETGSGFVEEVNGQAMDLSKGKRVFIPPFLWHRHGAKPGETMSHLAVTQGLTTWDRENKFDKDRTLAVPAY
jgi:quercetin dioxygenase-like cupin family protein